MTIFKCQIVLRSDIYATYKYTKSPVNKVVLDENGMEFEL